MGDSCLMSHIQVWRHKAPAIGQPQSEGREAMFKALSNLLYHFKPTYDSTGMRASWYFIQTEIVIQGTRFYNLSLHYCGNGAS